MARKTANSTQNTGSVSRNDGFSEKATGRGGRLDKVHNIAPSANIMMESTAREWYNSSGFIQTIVDAPAEDACREGISIRTNRDNDDLENNLQGLGISRLIENRLTELNIMGKLKDLIRYSRMYDNGGFMFLGVRSSLPQDAAELKDRMPTEILKLDYVNIISPERVSILEKSFDPLSSQFHMKDFCVSGTPVHSSRLMWMVNSYIPEDKRGISIIRTVLDAVLAQDTALWSVNHLLFEMATKIFKSSKVSGLSPDKLAEFVMKMKATLSTHSVVALDTDEDFTRLEHGPLTGIKEILDFIFENLAGFARMPKSRLMGQSQGVITAGQFDLLSYYDSIAKFQELHVRPILEKIISIIVSEKEGDIYKVLGGNTESLDWEFEFNPLWKIGPVEKADIELKEAQRDQIYITTTALSPDEVRQERFAELEEFSAWQAAPVSMKTPVILPREAEKKTEKAVIE